MIDFDDIWQKYSKVSRIEFACFSFHVGLLLSTFRLSNRTLKITPILTLSSKRGNFDAIHKEDKILIKNLHECKG